MKLVESNNKLKSKSYEDCIELLKFPKKYNIKKSEILDAGCYPVLTQDMKGISGYSNDAKKVFKPNGDEYILFGDHTTIFKYINFDFITGADGTKIFKTKNFINNKYLYYYSINNLIKPTGYNRHFKNLKEKVVSFPEDINEQKQIADLLDQQQNLINIYKEKLSILEQQESYYQDELLSGRLRIRLTQESINYVSQQKWITDGDIIKGKEENFENWLSEGFESKVEFFENKDWKSFKIFMKNKEIPKDWVLIQNKDIFVDGGKSKLTAGSASKDGKYPFFNCSESLSKWNKESNAKGEYLIFSTGGKPAIHYFNGDFAYSSDVYIAQTVEDFNTYYAYLFWKNNMFHLGRCFEGTGLQHLQKKIFKKESVFCPSLKLEQILISSFIKKIFNATPNIKDKIEIEEQKMEYLMDELLSGRIRIE
jgi:hypothetical protein